MALVVGIQTEKLQKYFEGGFCPIDLGDRIANRFTVLHKLGYGGFGTVWLVRDDQKRHGRYVALKVIAANWSREYENPEVVDRLKKYECDNGSPGVFLVELERVFPVLGPSLSALSKARALLYPSFAKGFARQLAEALRVMHSLGVCHGDFTLKNVAVGLDKPLDDLAEEELANIFGEPLTEFLDPWFIGDPSPGPQYAYGTVDLGLLPPDYLSTRLCVLDFDQAFLAQHPPAHLSHIPPQYLAPESIFSLTNSPAADIWALGSILHHLRLQAKIFGDFMSCDPEATVLRMYEVLGDLPREWRTFPFADGYPIHGPLKPGTKYETFESVDRDDAADLEQLTREIREPCRPERSLKPRTGVEKFCLLVPVFDAEDDEGLNGFMAENTRPIRKEDVAIFAGLLRQIFTYNHRKRITAKQILEHPWLREPGQTPRHARPGMGVQKLSPRTNVDHSKSFRTPTQNAPVRLPAHGPPATKTVSAREKSPVPENKPEKAQGVEVLMQTDRKAHGQSRSEKKKDEKTDEKKKDEKTDEKKKPK